MIEKDLEFHRAVYQTCGNRYLRELIDLLRTKAHIVGYNAWSLPSASSSPSASTGRSCGRSNKEPRPAGETGGQAHHFSRKSYQAN